MIDTYLAEHAHVALYFLLVMGWDDVLIALALLVISATITALTTKQPARPADAVASALADFDVPQVDEGTAQTVVFGDVWLTGWQVLWYGNLNSTAITGAKQGGKK